MTFTLASFNAHAGLRPRTNGVCVPYDVAGAIEALDADVIVVQETWWPDGEPSQVQVAAERLGAEMFELPFGRGTIEPWPHVRRDGIGSGDVGLAVAQATNLFQQAQAATERMSLPVVLLFAGFLIFIGYPAIARVLTGF